MFYFVYQFNEKDQQEILDRVESLENTNLYSGRAMLYWDDYRGCTLIRSLK